MKYDETNPYPCIENVNRRTRNIIQVRKQFKNVYTVNSTNDVHF